LHILPVIPMMPVVISGIAAAETPVMVAAAVGSGEEVGIPVIFMASKVQEVTRRCRVDGGVSLC